MKGKSRSLSLGRAVLEREFESLLRRAARLRTPGAPGRLRKVSRRKSAAADWRRQFAPRQFLHAFRLLTVPRS